MGRPQLEENEWGGVLFVSKTARGRGTCVKARLGLLSAVHVRHVLPMEG